MVAKVLPKDFNFFPKLAYNAWAGKNRVPQEWQYSPDQLNYINKIKGGIKTGLKVTALLGAGITTAIIGINLLNKHVFSMEAKMCKGKTGKERTICMSEASITAAQKAMKKAEDALVNCDAAKDPQECRYKMKVEIRSWMKKIRE